MSLIRPEAGVRISGSDVLSLGLRAVVADLNKHMPSVGTAVVEITHDDPRQLAVIVKYAQNVSDILNRSQELWNMFPATVGSKRPKYNSPDTWVLGVRDPEQTEVSRHGLFVKMNGGHFRDEPYVRDALRADPSFKVDFRSLDLERLTGRSEGSISVILEREYLEQATIVDFQPKLIEDLKFPNRMVDFPLGGIHFLIARGEAFLSGYARLLSDYGVKTNLPTTV